MFDCKLCDNRGMSAKALASHLKSHKISSREYYDKYLKSAEEGLCVVCSRPASFTNIVKGYGRTCSRECLKKDPDRAAKIIATKKQKYGDDMAAIYEKQKDTVRNWSNERKIEHRNKVSVGVRAAIEANPSIVTRRKATIAALGIDIGAAVSQAYANRTQDETAATTAKRKQTNLERYGVETVMQVPEIKEKVISALTTEKRLVAAQKAKATNIANGRILADDDPARDKKKDYKYRVRQISEQWAALSFPAEDLAKRSLNGVEGAVQLDHMVSLEECYRHNIAPEIAGHITNLRIISWEHNISKSRHSSMSVDELLHKYDEYMQKDW